LLAFLPFIGERHGRIQRGASLLASAVAAGDCLDDLPDADRVERGMYDIAHPSRAAAIAGARRALCIVGRAQDRGVAAPIALAKYAFS